MSITDVQFQAETFTGSTLRGRLFHAGKKVLSSEFQWRNHLAKVLDKYPVGASIVELGSGCRRIRSDVKNVDLFSFPNVDIVATLHPRSVSCKEFATDLIDVRAFSIWPKLTICHCSAAGCCARADVQFLHFPHRPRLKPVT